MPAVAAHVARREPGNQGFAAGQQRLRDMRKEQVAEVVAVPGTEEDDGWHPAIMPVPW